MSSAWLCSQKLCYWWRDWRKYEFPLWYGLLDSVHSLDTLQELATVGDLHEWWVTVLFGGCTPGEIHSPSDHTQLYAERHVIFWDHSSRYSKGNEAGVLPIERCERWAYADFNHGETVWLIWEKCFHKTMYSSSCSPTWPCNRCYRGCYARGAPDIVTKRARENR